MDDNAVYSPENKNWPDIGEKHASTSMILGIVALGITVFKFYWPSLIAFICSIIGLVYASKAKQEGCLNGDRTAGFVCSLIALILSCVKILVYLLIFQTIFGALWLFF